MSIKNRERVVDLSAVLAGEAELLEPLSAQLQNALRLAADP